jgi:hypothetical protein
MPFRPTLPFDHGCRRPLDAVVEVLRLARRWSTKPGERPVPRESTRTMA